MSDNVKASTPEKERSAEDAARSRPVSLPVGSYKLKDLEGALEEATFKKNADKRDEVVKKALDKTVVRVEPKDKDQAPALPNPENPTANTASTAEPAKKGE